MFIFMVFLLNRQSTAMSYEIAPRKFVGHRSKVREYHECEWRNFMLTVMIIICIVIVFFFASAVAIFAIY